MLQRDRELLERALAAAVAGGSQAGAAQRAGELARACEGATGAEADGLLDAVAGRIGSMSVDDIVGVIRFITARFHLLNKAEQLNIARVNRERERAAGPTSPRPESVAAAVVQIAAEDRGGGI